MRFRIITIAAFSMLANLAIAQNELDALRYSQTYMKGSARFTAMGGAFGALGGDISSFMVNPAGIGLYRSSEFTFSTGIFNSNLKTDYRDNQAFDNYTTANIGNTGIVLTMYSNNATAIKNFNIGVSYNRVNDLSMNTTLSGYNNHNSISDYFAAQTNGIDRKFFRKPNYNDPYYLFNVRTDDGKYLPLESILAWESFLIDPKNDVDGNKVYISQLGINDAVYQKRWENIRGFNDLINIPFGGNVYDVVYFGGSFDINNINYHSTRTHYEKAAEGNSTDPNRAKLDQFWYDQFYNAYGTGYSLSLGIILKPIQELRIGVSYKSPTWTFIEEDYSAEMQSNFTNVQSTGPDNKNISQTPIYTNSYRVNSPQRLTGSVAAVLGKFAILSADFDWINYADMKMKGDRDSDFSSTNKTIKNTFRNTLNLRLGGEIKLTNFAFRAGYQYYQNPYKSEFLNGEYPTHVYSSGFGYRTRSFFLDFAYSLTQQKNSYTLYDFYDPNFNPAIDIYSGTATQNINKNAYILTVGFKF